MGKGSKGGAEARGQQFVLGEKVSGWEKGKKRANAKMPPGVFGD